MWTLRVPLCLTLKMVRFIQSLDGVVVWCGTKNYTEQLEFEALGITQLHCRSVGDVEDKAREYLTDCAKNL